jgi:hypothetical protein
MGGGEGFIQSKNSVEQGRGGGVRDSGTRRGNEGIRLQDPSLGLHGIDEFKM